MFYIALSVVFVMFVLWGGMVWLRKSLWDTVHRNLLDMEDVYDGKVIRDGFIARPVFHGKIGGKSITVNFSSARAGNKRQNYIDLSLAAKTSQTLTITDANWLKSQNGDAQNPDSQVVETARNVIYHIMPASKPAINKLVTDSTFLALLDSFDHLAYFFVGKTGAICEFFTEALDKDTEFPVMEKRLGQIDALLQLIEKI